MSLLIKIGTITINTFLPTRNKTSHSCSIKVHASGFDELLVGCGSIFPEKSSQDSCRSGNRLVKGQVNMIDEAKHHSLIYSTFERWLRDMGSGVVEN